MEIKHGEEAVPAEYQWLTAEPGPKMVKEAIKLYGVFEQPGDKNNPIIMAWAKEICEDVDRVYYADAVPWCGLFMAVVAKRAGKVVVKEPLWALNWGSFGHHVSTPMLGDVLVFTRTTPGGSRAGHVGLYIGETDTHYLVLGGNQNDKVCIARQAKSRLYTARRPDYKVQPSNVRVVKLQVKSKEPVKND